MIKATIHNVVVSDIVEDVIVELPVIASVSRGLWRSLSRSSRRVYLDDVMESKLAEDQQIITESQIDKTADES